MAAQFRPEPLVEPTATAKLALRHLARRHASLSAENAELDRDLAQPLPPWSLPSVPRAPASSGGSRPPD